MRISDWSSDVCSSDLLSGLADIGPDDLDPLFQPPADRHPGGDGARSLPLQFGQAGESQPARRPDHGGVAGAGRLGYPGGADESQLARGAPQEVADHLPFGAREVFRVGAKTLPKQRRCPGRTIVCILLVHGHLVCEPVRPRLPRAHGYSGRVRPPATGRHRGVPSSGCGTITALTPKTALTSPAVSRSAGAPDAWIFPSATATM